MIPADPAVRRLLRIASQVSGQDPLLGYELRRSTLSFASELGKVAVVNPGVQSFEDHVESMVGVLKSLRHEIEGALRDLDDAEEFAKFFSDGFAEEDALKKILERTKKLGRAASTSETSGFKDFWKSMVKKFKDDDSDDSASMVPSYTLDESTMDDFVEGSSEWADASYFIEQEFRENKEFFDGAHEVIQQLEKVRKSPSRETAERLRDRIDILIRRGGSILKGIRKHLLEPAPRINLEDGEDPESSSEPNRLSPAVLESTVEHYVDMLRENLGDEGKTLKFLKELYSHIGPMIEVERGSFAARRKAQKRILPILIRFAHRVPSSRSTLLPIIRQASGR